MNARKGRAPMSFSMEQLGISKGETLPASVRQPSTSTCYPLLENKPQPIELTAEMNYLIELKRSFTEYMRESPNYVRADVVNEDVERYCVDPEEIVTENDARYEAYHDWSRLPEELRTSTTRRLQRKNVKENKNEKDTDIVKKLAELETRESMQQPAEEEDKEEGDEEENNEAKETADRVKIEEEVDEMDDGTDYANEYFETGDNYYSEDDNDDDQFFDT